MGFRTNTIVFNTLPRDCRGRSSLTKQPIFVTYPYLEKEHVGRGRVSFGEQRSSAKWSRTEQEFCLVTQQTAAIPVRYGIYKVPWKSNKKTAQ